MSLMGNIIEVERYRSHGTKSAQFVGALGEKIKLKNIKLGIKYIFI